MKTTTLPLKHSANRVSRRFALLIPLALASFALSPQARAVCQEGCLDNSNTALGEDVLASDTGGSNNTGIGWLALNTNVIGSFNTAVGGGALQENTADYNTAIGVSALTHNTVGTANVATGPDTLYANTNGLGNTAMGYFALYSNSTGDDNTGVGSSALMNNTTGNFNIAIGSGAGSKLSTGSNNIDIGNAGMRGETRRIRIGTPGTQGEAYIAGIRGVSTRNADAIPVVIDSAGQLGTISSSRRFKKEIKAMAQTSDAILALKPVTFHYKSDSKSTPQFGLIAEDVAKVNPDLVVRDEQGKPYTVRYDAVNAMLLNEFLKEHRKNERQEATIAELQKQVEALTAGLQKVSAQLQLNKGAPETVSNSH